MGREIEWYAIVGGYTGLVIGATTNPGEVQEEEPAARFVPISKAEFDACDGLDAVVLAGRPLYQFEPVVEYARRQIGIVEEPS